MDTSGFAQSRGDDDLFDDELIPIVPDEVDAVADQLQESSIQQETPPDPTPRESTPRETAHRGPRVRGGPNKIRGLLRGRGRGGAQASQLPRNSPTDTPAEDRAESPAEQASDSGVQATKSDQEQQPTRPQAVRGDRLATGGVKKPKLTEEELTAKMAEAKARATALSEAHARAQADAESFEERERMAREKRKVTAARDAANRQVMDHEREANRRRKMQAQGIREWDMEKHEDDFSGRGRGRGYTRGVHGGVRHERKQDSEAALEFDHTTKPTERGRGGRGRGRGRGGAGATERDGASNIKGLAGSKYAQPDFSKESEFPALPPGLKPAVGSAEKVDQPDQIDQKASGILTGGSSGETWAEQVESSATGK